ncbi:hypothetical protein J2X31_003641 [Flavobacterium arsenatis]|uniref:Uncharacterized protein n=1 Tax=Flavobacterium arsenatis TaxID=1484332 RepID=A0ABU1TUP3_9FLAO|nr:hypothetical protein [Flavobacterium arsenatis]MDR6969608.1 hypothetical protein [Flavobacterium arsenatis]
MKKAFFTIILTYSTVVSAQNKDIEIVRDEQTSDNKSVWVKEGKNKASFKINFRGGCCDMPLPEMMNAEVVNDTLYIDKAVENHSRHDDIGICGTSVKIIIDTKSYPDYKKLILFYKKLESTKKRRVPHYKG